MKQRRKNRIELLNEKIEQGNSSLKKINVLRYVQFLKKAVQEISQGFVGKHIEKKMPKLIKAKIDQELNKFFNEFGLNFGIYEFVHYFFNIGYAAIVKINPINLRASVEQRGLDSFIISVLPIDKTGEFCLDTLKIADEEFKKKPKKVVEQETKKGYKNED